MSKADELARERAYLNRVLHVREQKREFRRAAPTATTNGHSDGRVVQDAAALSQALGSPETPVAIGRIVVDDDQLYIGHASIVDIDGSMLAVNWKLPAAVPYFKANHLDSLGVRSKRTFTIDRHNLVDFEEIVFEALARQVAALESTAGESFDGPDVSLLQELDHKRSGEMREI